jgi:hypothetical protein
MTSATSQRHRRNVEPSPPNFVNDSSHHVVTSLHHQHRHVILRTLTHTEEWRKRERKRSRREQASKQSMYRSWNAKLWQILASSSFRRSLRRLFVVLFVVKVRRVETSTSSASTSFKGYRYPVRLTQGKRQPTEKGGHRCQACLAAGVYLDVLWATSLFHCNNYEDNNNDNYNNLDTTT